MGEESIVCDTSLLLYLVGDQCVSSAAGICAGGAGQPAFLPRPLPRKRKELSRLILDGFLTAQVAIIQDSQLRDSLILNQCYHAIQFSTLSLFILEK